MIPANHGQTLRYAQLSSADIRSGETIVAARDSTENRGRLSLWNEISIFDPGKVIWIEHINSDHIRVTHVDKVNEISLHDETKLREMCPSAGVLIDISGLQHNAWAPIMRAVYGANCSTRVLYAEPDSYKIHPSPASATQFDLSVTFGGWSPLPGFAKLLGPADESKCIFIALLGFEGNRPERLVLQVDPPPKVVPVVGVPGFQIEFPAFTIACNRAFLEETRAYSEIRYARASCPFETVAVLKAIRKEYPDHYLYLAPVGTKPHALGAILFALLDKGDNEVLFDHPVRKPGRTKGIGVIHIFDFGRFHEL